jgi:hypothetical protein
MLAAEQEAICRAIDQRARDAGVVAREQDRLDRYREPIPVSWTGVMTISNRYLNAVIVRDCDEVTHEAMWGEPKLRQLWGVDPRGWFQ